MSEACCSLMHETWLIFVVWVVTCKRRLRSRAVYLVRSVGKSQSEAAEAVGASRQAVNPWLQRHAGSGDEGLLDGRRVSARKVRGLLTPVEAGRVRGWITDKYPEQLNLPYALWTAGAVRELIRRRLGKELGLSTVQLYLSRWGLTPQKPLSRATQRSDAAIARWLDQEFPKIARRAKRDKALIFWAMRPASAIRTRLVTATRRKDGPRWYAGRRRS